MRVAVHEAGLEELVQRAPHAAFQQIARRQTRRGDGVDVREPSAVDPLHHEHGARAQLVEHRRRPHQALQTGTRAAADAVDVAKPAYGIRLSSVVHLVEDSPDELVDDAHDVAP